LFVRQTVILTTPVEAILSRPGSKTTCDRCGEEIINEREVAMGAATLCRHCAYGGYYTTCPDADQADELPVLAATWPRAYAVAEFAPTP
jgi:late competence protein required for DNA uptake (superfamily II DNA/RNA helicase)